MVLSHCWRKMTKHNYSRWKNKKRESKSTASDPKRTNGYFRCRVSIDRSTHPASFIRWEGCHTSLGFPKVLTPIAPHKVCPLLGYLVSYTPVQKVKYVAVCKPGRQSDREAECPSAHNPTKMVIICRLNGLIDWDLLNRSQRTGISDLLVPYLYLCK